MYDPAAHDVQKLSPDPGWTVPIAHARQEDNPVALANVPGPHCTHMVWLADPPYEPRGHPWQVDGLWPAVIRPWVPAGHEVQVLAPADAM